MLDSGVSSCFQYVFVHQLDVFSAICYADIEGDVYINPTPNFQILSEYCFKLKKTLIYGLRSSPR